MKNQDVSLITLPQFLDHRGNLAVIEQLKEIPFEIKRCHWIYDVPGGGAREGHAYRTNQELIIAVSGAFDVDVKRFGSMQRFTLARAYEALYIPAGTWRELSNFSTNAVAVVLSSTHYDESDYIFDYNEYFSLI